MDASQRASELIARDLTGSDIRTAIPGWPEDPDPSAPFDAVLRVNDEDLPIEVRARILPDGLVVASIRDARALIAGREAQALLVEAEQKYRSLVEQIPAVVYSDDGEFTNYVSPQIEEILGVTAAEYLADPDTWMRMVHPDDRATVEAESDAFLAGHGGDLTDYRMVRPDGRIVWIRDRAFAQRDEEGRVIWEQGILFDVTELKDAEARIAHMAFHDGLTGLANRQLFEETLELALERGATRPVGGGGALPGSRQLQAGQRYVRTPRGRPPPDRGGAAAAGFHAWHRPRGSAGRRRVPDPARGSRDRRRDDDVERRSPVASSTRSRNRSVCTGSTSPRARRSASASSRTTRTTPRRC